MPKFTVKEREYNVSLVDGIINITCIDWTTMKEYVCDVGQTYLSNYRLIDTIEDLYDFIIEGFESKDNPFFIKIENNKITLSSTISSKYKSENHEFVLENKKNVDMYNELNNRMKYYQKKMEEMENTLSVYRTVISEIISLNYVKLPDCSLIQSNINMREQFINDITISYDKTKKKFIINMSCITPSILYLNTVDEVRKILIQFKKGILTLWLKQIPIKDLVLNDIIPINYTVKILYLVDMVEISDFDNFEITNTVTVHILGSCCSNIKWSDFINHKNVKELFVDVMIPINGIVPITKNCGNVTCDGKIISTNLYKRL